MQDVLSGLSHKVHRDGNEGSRDELASLVIAELQSKAEYFVADTTEGGFHNARWHATHVPRELQFPK